MLNKCNNIICSSYKEKNINCKRFFLTTQEEFDKIKHIVDFIITKFEHTTFRYLYYHIYIQLVNRLTMKQTKTLLESDKISFPKGVLLKGDSKQARDYILKHFGRCMIHHDEEKGKYCKCDFFKRELGDCKICTDNCQQNRKNEILNEEGAVIYQFGKYRYMTRNSDNTIDKINNNNFEDQEKKKYIIKNQIKLD